MKKKLLAVNYVLPMFFIALLTGCKPENTLSTHDCVALHQGFIKVINNYNGNIRVYIDKSGINSYNYDLLVPNGETRIYTTGIGTHSYTITDEVSITLDQAQLLIPANCDTTVISKTNGGGGGGGGGGNSCATGSWGTIKIQNTYGQNIRVYIDNNSPNSYNYNLFIPNGQTRYIYNMSIGPHKYAIMDEVSVTLDQAQVQVNGACDSVLIAKNVPFGVSSIPATGCASGGWGAIKVVNTYNHGIRVYVDPTAVNSYNYNLYIPAGQSRFYFSANQGVHDFTIADDVSIVLDKARVYVNAACDTAVLGPANNGSTAGATTGCAGNDWGTVKVVNTRSEKIRVYFAQSSPNSYNYDMMVPANCTRYFYNIPTGAADYLVTDVVSVTIDQAQVNIANSCDVETLTIN